MKKNILFVTIICISLFANAQKTKSCCAISANDEFVRMSSSIGFQSMHDIPTNMVIDTNAGKTITYKNTDGKPSNAWVINSKNKKSDIVIFVIHEWWGLNNFVKNEAIKLSEALPDANIYCLDMYDGKIATSRDSAAAYMGAIRTPRAETIIKGALNKVGKKAIVYTVGWCFGGGWSLQASILAGKQGRGCVMYYGMPEKNVEKLKLLNADVLCVHPTKDKWITQKLMDEFADNMRSAYRNLKMLQYDADHAFANPSNTTNYSKPFADNAFEEMIAFYKLRMVVRKK
jgi:carboxymethylenebutenolidase